MSQKKKHLFLFLSFFVLIAYVQEVSSEDIDLSYSEEEHHQMSREFGAESIVLAKNVGLPLKPTDKVMLFGGGTFDTQYGGTGSGEVWGTKSTWISEGIETKAKEGKIINEWNVKFTLENDLTEDDVKKMADKGEKATRSVAVMTIKRSAGEGLDRNLDGDREGMFISDNEINTFKLLEKYFDQIVIVLNVCGYVEIMDFVESEKTSILIVHYPGMQVGHAIADVLVGDVNPSGHLPDTWAKKIRRLSYYIDLFRK